VSTEICVLLTVNKDNSANSVHNANLATNRNNTTLAIQNA